MTYGNNIDLKQVQTNIFNFSGNIVIQSLHNSQLLKFDDLVLISETWERSHVVNMLTAGSYSKEIISSEAS